MNKLLAAFLVVALAGLAIWVTGVKPGTDAATAGRSEAAESTYDYDARDVVVQQMGPDGTLQYELEAKQISQLPRNGQISAKELVMHHDPAGAPPGGEYRWTLTADHADLPEPGAPINLQGSVHAEGRLQGSRTLISMATEQLTYNLDTQDAVSSKPVVVNWGNSRLRCGNLSVNIKRGTLSTLSVESQCNGSSLP